MVWMDSWSGASAGLSVAALALGLGVLLLGVDGCSVLEAVEAAGGDLNVGSDALDGGVLIVAGQGGDGLDGDGLAALGLAGLDDVDEGGGAVVLDARLRG